MELLLGTTAMLAAVYAAVAVWLRQVNARARAEMAAAAVLHSRRSVLARRIRTVRDVSADARDAGLFDLVNEAVAAANLADMDCTDQRDERLSAAIDALITAGGDAAWVGRLAEAEQSWKLGLLVWESSSRPSPA